ncbi:MAG: hypothetical protein EOP46_02700 [Sphingobacteriaceae bacterium]|nr:MAG: hypothetical protein EOP46_02700 [Sphingobacteriaceae bacterium]
MLMTIFTPIYEALCGSTDYTEYRDDIFGSVGVITIVSAVVLALVFYVVLGRWRMVWFNRAHWAYTIVITAALGFTIAYLTGKSVLELVDGYLIRFAIINAIYAAIYFIIFSLIFKNLSVFAKRTPF